MTNVREVIFDSSLVLSLLATIFFIAFFLFMTAIFTCTSGCPDKTMSDYILRAFFVVITLTNTTAIYTQFRYDSTKVWQLIPTFLAGSTIMIFTVYGIVFDPGDIIIYIPMLILGIVMAMPFFLFYNKR